MKKRILIEFVVTLVLAIIVAIIIHSFHYDALVIIDPGHGGEDPGAVVTENGITYAEEAYAFDVAARLGVILKKKKIQVVFTTTRSNGNRPEDKRMLLWNKYETYTLNGQPVLSGQHGGLKPRVELARDRYEKTWARKSYFISLHFDSTVTSVSGCHVITDSNCKPFAEQIGHEMKAKGLARRKNLETFLPVVCAGDKEHGIVNAYILSQKNNPIPNRVLVEMGNLKSPVDLKRIQNPLSRQTYAECIARTILQ